MKKSYNFLSGCPFIKLNNNEVKIIREALKICDEGAEFARKIYKDEEFIYEQWTDFRRAKMYLHFVLSRGRIYYYKKRERAIENFSKYMRTVKGIN
ncbi:hypothetical protein ES708_29279 [subsurface metagenome]